MKAKTLYAAAAALALLSATGCEEDVINVSDKFNRPLNAALPVLKGEGTAKAVVERWLDGTKWSENDEGVLQVTYLSIDSASADDALKLADATFAQNTYVAAAADGKASVTIPTSKWNTVEGQLIESLQLKGGSLKFNAPAVSAAGKARLTVEHKLGKVKDASGNVLAVEWNLADGADIVLDMSGCEIEPLEDDDEGYMYVNIVIDLSELEGGAQMSISGSIEDLLTARAYGYFGNHLVLDGGSGVRLAIFDRYDFPDGVEFTGMYADINLSSTVGAPLQWSMTDITFTDDEGGKHSLGYDFTGVKFTQQSYNDYLASKLLTPQTQSIHIDESNSNIYDAINVHPVQYEYEQTLIANPDGKVKGETNFITDESQFKSEVKTVIPMNVRITELTYDEDADLDMRDIFDDENIDYVDTIRIKIITDNGLPVRGYGQGYFTADGKVVGQLFDESTLICRTAQLDENDLVVAPTHTETIGIITHDEARKYYDLGVDKIHFACNATTEDTGDRFVKIFAKYNVTWKVTLSVTSSAKNIDL